MKNGIMKTFLIITGMLVLVILANSTGFCEGAPSLNSLKPTRGGPGDIIVIYGSDLGETKGKSEVMFGSVKAPVVSWSDKKVSVTVPLNVDPKDLVETGKKRRKKTVLPVYIKVEEAGKTDLRYFDILPSIKSLHPNNGGPGEKISISGRNFGSYIDQGKVFVGSKEAKITRWTKKSIEFIMPDSINTSDMKEEKKRKRTKRWIDVYVQAGKIKGGGKEFYWNPEIRRVDPNEAGPGSKISISGRNFGKLVNSITVVFGNKKVKALSLNDDGITAKIPESISQEDIKDGKLEVSVTVGGVDSNSKGISVSPELERIHPSSSHGGILTLKGKKFGAANDSNKVFFETKTGKLSGELKGKILSWKDDEIKIEIPMNLNKSDDDLVINIKIKSGKFYSNEKEYKYRKVEKKKERKPKKEKPAKKEESK